LARTKEKKYVDYDNNSRDILIAFDEIFERPNIAHMNKFSVNKRSYYNCLDLISQDINTVLNSYEDFAYSLLEIRYSMFTDDDYTYVKFYNDIKRLFIENEDLRAVISKMVEDSYSLDLNDIKSDKKFNVELQVTDELNKIYLKSTIMMRLLIPLICDFKCEDNVKETLIYEVNTGIIKSFDNNTNHALNKLYKIIYSRVYQTRYSDTVIWKYMKNMAIDLSITVKRYFRVVINNIFPKIKHDTSVISYLDVVIKQKLKYLFTYKYPISYKPLKAESTDDEELSEQERMEINLLRNDEGNSLINEFSIKQEINIIKKEFGVNDSDIEEFIGGRELNTIQIYLIKIYYSSKFKVGTNRKEIFYLMYGMAKQLEKLSFSIIPTVLSCEVAPNVRKMNNRKKLVEKVVSSEKYKGIIKEYLPISNILDRNNFILSLMTIKNNKFLDEERQEVEILTDQLAEEVLDLVTTI
jgi:hypothetical protein